MTAILAVHGLRKRFGALAVTQDVDLAVPVRGLHAIIGPNGAGKTTLVNQLMGTLRPDAGRILLADRDITGLPPHQRARAGLARTFQISQLIGSFTARQNAALAAQARLPHRIRAWGRAETAAGANEAADAALADVGLSDRADIRARDLSHGERRGLEIACALALAPRALLLDEPLAGTGHEEAARLIELLAGLKTRLGMLLVEHDMDAVFRLADSVSVLVAGRVIASGDPAAVRADAAVRAAYLGEA